MKNTIESIRAQLKHLNALAAPASTLLWASIMTVLVSFAMKAAFGKPSHRIEQLKTCSSTAPGESIQIRVTGDPNAKFSAYLPGLTSRRVYLNFDAESGHHVGSIRVPNDAPSHGFLTVRVTSPEPQETDRRIQLRSPKTGQG